MHPTGVQEHAGKDGAHVAQVQTGGQLRGHQRVFCNKRFQARAGHKLKDKDDNIDDNQDVIDVGHAPGFDFIMDGDHFFTSLGS